MMMIDLIGKPYDFKSYNCWHHAVFVRDQVGIKTKQFAPRTLENAFKVITAQMQALGHGLLKVDAPQDYDICIVHKKISGREVYHCGVYFEGRVSHCCREARQVRFEELSAFQSGFEGITFWR